jgi:hypothetical protein
VLRHPQLLVHRLGLDLFYCQCVRRRDHLVFTHVEA